MRHRLALVVALLASAAPIAAQDGVTYTFRTVATTTSALPSAPDTPAAPPSTGRTLLLGGKMRMEYTDSLPHPPAGVGAVMVNTGKRLVYLDPAKHVYFAIDTSMMAQTMERLRAAGSTMRFTDPVVRVERLGAGEPLLGQPTERWRLTQSSTIVMSMMGTEITMRSESSSEMLFGNVPVGRGDEDPSQALTKSTLFPPEFMDRLRAAWRTLPARLPLRSVVTSITRRGDQEVTRSTSTTDVLSVSRGPIAPDAFVVPAGYQEVPFPVPGAPNGRAP